MVGTGVQEGSCLTRSFISLDKFGKFNIVRKGSLGLTRGLKVLVWGLEGLAPIFPYVKVGFPPTASFEVDELFWK